LPQGAFPVFQTQIEALGFHSDFSQLKAIAAQLNHDATASEDLALAIASPLTLSLYGADWAILPLDLGLRVGDVLMLHRELIDQPRAAALISTLREHLHTLALQHGCVQVLADPAAR
jgi:hypothetical protein